MIDAKVLTIGFDAISKKMSENRMHLISIDQQGTFKWNPVKNAIGYIVYDGEQILGTTTDTSFPVSEVNYALKVSAVNQYGTQGKKGVL